MASPNMTSILNGQSQTCSKLQNDSGIEDSEVDKSLEKKKGLADASSVAGFFPSRQFCVGRKE